MKTVVTLAVAAALVCASSAFAQSKSIQEQNNYARSVQRADEAKRVQNNNSVNKYAQTQRYNATRPYTPPPTRSYIAPKSYSPPARSYTPPPKSYSPPPRSYSPPPSTYKRR